jgi:hypothetical protein
LWRRYRYRGSDFGQSQFLEFGAVKPGTSLLTLRRDVLPTSSGLKSKPSKEATKTALCCLLGLIFDPENGDTMFLRNVELQSEIPELQIKWTKCECFPFFKLF